MDTKFSLNSVELQEYQPNRYPFLMIDYVDEVSPGKYARGYKNMTMNEWFFPVHFPSGPNMPGALCHRHEHLLTCLRNPTQPYPRATAGKVRNVGRGGGGRTPGTS